MLDSPTSHPAKSLRDCHLYETLMRTVSKTLQKTATVELDC